MNAPLGATEYAARLKSGLAGAYLFCGEEVYLRVHYLDKTRVTLLGDGDDPFNHIMLDTIDGGLELLGDALASPPFCALHKLVELAPFDPSALSESDMTALCELADSIKEDTSTILVLVSPPDLLDVGNTKSPGKYIKLLSPHFTVVNFARETPAKLASWAYRHFSSRKISASPQLCAALVARTGRDMTALSGEIEKLCAYLGATGRIELTENDIRFVASENIESDPFDFSNALLEGDTERALALLSEYKLRRDPPELILAGMTRVYCDLILVRLLSDGGDGKQEISLKLKMHEYKVGLYLACALRIDPDNLRSALDCCYETDIKLKSTQLDGYMLLDRLAVALSTLRGGVPV